MIRPDHIINKRKEMLEILEQEIDEKLVNHFEDHITEMRFDIQNKKLTENEIEKLTNTYRSNGWFVKREKGCDDHPCGDYWDYIAFNLPNA